MGKLFGTDGIRSIAGQYPVNEEIGWKLGRSIVEYCKARNIDPVIVIGRDTRESGEMLEKALAAGVLSAGGSIKLVGVLPTPGIAYLTIELGGGAGIVISASHNPHEYNGFKVFSNQGFKLSEDEEAELEAMILKETSSSFPVSRIEPELIKDSGDRYISFLIKTVKEDITDIKIIIDCANGATFRVAPALFKRIGMKAEAIFIGPDGKNINKDCGSQHTEALSKKVLETQADLGIAFDGDGDRLIAVDETGKSLTGDQILTIYAKMLQDRGELKNGIVVSTVMSNMGFKSALKDFGVKHVATSVGDRYVMEEMKRQGGIVGGEDSGHIIFSNYHTTGDGILSALELLSAIKMFNKPLSELASLMTIYPQTLINVPVKIKPDISQVPDLLRVIEEAEKGLGEDGRVLVRYSGTEPLCRVMVEGKRLEDIEDYARVIADAVAKNLNS